MSIDVTPLQDITRRVEELSKNVYGGYDNERFHAEEDEILTDALGAIAAGNPESQEIARAALDVKSIKYNRWYA